MDKNKSTWDYETIKVFLRPCIDQISKNERRGLTFTPKAWANIVSTFNEKTGKQYGRKQLKKRLDVLRKEFITWVKLINETGAGRDTRTNKVVASDEWWQQKIQEHDAYKKFRHKNLMFENEMRIIFMDVMATPEYIFSSSSTQPLTQQEDVYRPSMEVLEGSGDNEDDMFGAIPLPITEVADELRGIGLTTNTPSTGPTESRSRGKRKIGEGSAQRKRHKKMLASKQIADAVSVIANASKKRAALSEIQDGSSVDAAFNELLELEEVQCDDDFRNRCMTLLEDKTLREIFLSIAKRNKQYLISWLWSKVKDF